MIGVPVRAQRERAIMFVAAKALFVLGLRILCPSSRTTRRQETENRPEGRGIFAGADFFFPDGRYSAASVPKAGQPSRVDLSISFTVGRYHDVDVIL